MRLTRIVGSIFLALVIAGLAPIALAEQPGGDDDYAHMRGHFPSASAGDQYGDGSLIETRSRHDGDDDDDDDNQTARRGIEGSWFATITGTPFKILRTITRGGVVDAYAFPPITPTAGPLINSAGHGNWKKIGPRTYAVTVQYFQLNPELNSTFDILDSVGTVRETIVVSKDGQSYESVFDTVVELSGGGTILNSGATVAERIKVELLP